MSNLEHQVEQRLREHDIRFTRGRRVVVDVLASSDGPRSAAELADDIGAIVPLSSLYRSLAVLEEAGVLIPHHGARSVTRYELAEWLLGHHHHLVCSSCETVEDIAIPKPQEDRVRELVNEISASATFEPQGHTLEIEGLCSRCM